MAVTVDATKGAYIIPALAGSGYVPLAGGTMTGALTIASGTLTASAPALNITQTWNSGATAFTGALIDITNTASSGSSRAIDVKIAGTSIFSIRPDGYAIASAGLFVGSGGTNGLWDPAGPRVKSTGFFSWAQSANATDTADLVLYRDAAATLAQRNGTTQQIFRLYNTYTDASNYERLTLTGVAGTSVNISAESLGTGSSNLDVVITPKGTGKVGIGGTPSWKLSVVSSTTACDLAVKDSVGALVLTTASGAAFISTNTAQPLIFRTNGVEKMRIGDNGLLSFGDVTSSYPALKRSTTALQFRLADDSGYADATVRNLLNTEYHQMTEMAAPSAPATNSVRIYAEDNGSGKTRLMAIFATGAAQQIAIEP